jgi:hypothetical protein
LLNWCMRPSISVWSTSLLASVLVPRSISVWVRCRKESSRLAGLLDAPIKSSRYIFELLLLIKHPILGNSNCSLIELCATPNRP